MQALTKRLHSLHESSYIGETKPAERVLRAHHVMSCESKAHLAMFLKEHSMRYILDPATDTQTTVILLALL
jgi:hypothetical protein